MREHLPEWKMHGAAREQPRSGLVAGEKGVEGGSKRSEGAAAPGIRESRDAVGSSSGARRWSRRHVNHDGSERGGHGARHTSHDGDGVVKPRALRLTKSVF